MADNIDHHIAVWEALVDRYVDHRNKVAGAAPSLDNGDVRLAMYGIPGNVLVTGLLNLKMTKTCLLSTPWWDANVKNNRELEKRQHQTDEYVTHSKVAVYLLSFSFFEAGLRELLRFVRPGACDNGFAAFESIYKALLTHLSLQKHIELLDFGRTLRNLIHNNGTYFSKDGSNKKLSFNGVEYVFEHRKKVTFAYTDLLFQIYDGLLLVADDLNAHTDIQALPPMPMP
jgi:hypothetical protein